MALLRAATPLAATLNLHVAVKLLADALQSQLAAAKPQPVVVLLNPHVAAKPLADALQSQHVAAKPQHAAVLLNPHVAAKLLLVDVLLSQHVAAKLHADVLLNQLAAAKLLADAARSVAVCWLDCSTARKALAANQLAAAKFQLADVQNQPVPLQLLADATWAATADVTLAAAPRSAAACFTSCSAT
ncbi:hypothetical protein LOC67_10160 [Stieleria sp. JC731]|uniref:hypothetical protein n=1 Tax=Pirellulaceae TaxID=2691357 RepID=UPI001E3803C1|nr:hypothetical protein [Stieleria sp. JC731]MCC9600930.1 hypothetical protein [Stieleria sp. JC731]